MAMTGLYATTTGAGTDSGAGTTYCNCWGGARARRSGVHVQLLKMIINPCCSMALSDGDFEKLVRRQHGNSSVLLAAAALPRAPRN